MRAAPRGPSLLFGRAGAEKTDGGASAFCAKKARAGGGTRLILQTEGTVARGRLPIAPDARARTRILTSPPHPPN